MSRRDRRLIEFAALRFPSVVVERDSVSTVRRLVAFYVDEHGGVVRIKYLRSAAAESALVEVSP